MPTQTPKAIYPPSGTNVNPPSGGVGAPAGPRSFAAPQEAPQAARSGAGGGSGTGGAKAIPGPIQPPTAAQVGPISAPAVIKQATDPKRIMEAYGQYPNAQTPGAPQPQLNGSGPNYNPFGGHWVEPDGSVRPGGKAAEDFEGIDMSDLDQLEAEYRGKLELLGG